MSERFNLLENRATIGVNDKNVDVKFLIYAEIDGEDDIHFFVEYDFDDKGLEEEEKLHIKDKIEEVASSMLEALFERLERNVEEIEDSEEEE